MRRQRRGRKKFVRERCVLFSMYKSIVNNTDKPVEFGTYRLFLRTPFLNKISRLNIIPSLYIILVFARFLHHHFRKKWLWGDRKNSNKMEKQPPLFEIEQIIEVEYLFRIIVHR